jgi:hypothetical protein
MEIIGTIESHGIYYIIHFLQADGIVTVLHVKARIPIENAHFASPDAKRKACIFSGFNDSPLHELFVAGCCSSFAAEATLGAIEKNSLRYLVHDANNQVNGWIVEYRFGLWGESESHWARPDSIEIEI